MRVTGERDARQKEIWERRRQIEQESREDRRPLNMNRVFQSSTSQQIMGGNPGWWNSMRPPPQQASPSWTSSSSPSAAAVFSYYPQQTTWHEDQDLPESWSQMLMGGLIGEEDRCNYSPFQTKKIDSLEDQALYHSMGVYLADVKQELSESGYPYGYGNEEIPTIRSTWSQVLQVYSPRSCVTSASSNLLDFSSSQVEGRRQPMDYPECNSTSNGAAVKKARIQPCPSANSTFKVRKEKLGDRITALHQLVSPFGKTDTASVLLEAIGYIRFLQSQIEALCSPYLGNGSGNMRQPQSEAQEEGSCIFPKDAGQLLNDTGMKKRVATEKEAEDGTKDLKSRGLCLVPLSSTLHVGNDNGADYWAPSLGGGFR